MSDDDLASATGLAIAVVAALIERPEPISRGEVVQCLRLLSRSASPERPRQSALLEGWAEMIDGRNSRGDLRQM